jgi:tetratricopeptide (TPR) repeat protein
MKHNQYVLLFLAVGLISLTGSLRADDSASTSNAPIAPTAQPTVASKPAKADNPIKAAMKAAGDLAAAGKTDEAIAAYEKIGVLPSKKAESWRLNCEGLAYLNATDPKADKAIPVFEKAVAVDASNSLAWNNLGTAYEQTDQLDKAKKAYQKSIDAAKETDANSDKATANLSDLQAKLDKIAAKKGGTKEADAADSGASAASASTTPAAGADSSK